MNLHLATSIAAACALAFGLSACAGLPGAGKPGGEPPSVTIKAMADAGCKIQFSVGFGGATGQLGGGVHAENTFSGSCDPANAKPPAAAGIVAATSIAPPSP